MAIGDMVGGLLGAATVNRQPSAGVEEKITFFSKDDTTDGISIYNGSATEVIIANNANLSANLANTTDMPWSYFNTAIMITNSQYLRKTGTTNQVGIAGVQTNS